MAKELNFLTLEQKGMRKATASGDDWIQFLQQCAHLNTLDFSSQLIVYAQNTSVKDLRSKDEWKEGGRAIQKRSKAIYLPGSEGEVGYYDFSSTTGDGKSEQKGAVLQPLNAEDVMYLGQTSGERNETRVSQQLLLLANRYSDQLPDDLYPYVEYSFLSTYPEENLRKLARTMTVLSAAVMTAYATSSPIKVSPDLFSDIRLLSDTMLFQRLGDMALDAHRTVMEELRYARGRRLAVETPEFEMPVFSDEPDIFTREETDAIVYEPDREKLDAVEENAQDIEEAPETNNERRESNERDDGSDERERDRVRGEGGRDAASEDHSASASGDPGREVRSDVSDLHEGEDALGGSRHAPERGADGVSDEGAERNGEDGRGIHEGVPRQASGTDGDSGTPERSRRSGVSVNRVLPPLKSLLWDEEAYDSPDTLPAAEGAPYFGYTVRGKNIYYRLDETMKLVDLPNATSERVAGMVRIRDIARALIEKEKEGESDEVLTPLRDRMNLIYDVFTAKYGALNSFGNSRAFSEDGSYSFIASLENCPDGKTYVKGGLFEGRVLSETLTHTHSDTSYEALTQSIVDRGYVDFAYMEDLTGKTKKELRADLTGAIYDDPETGRCVTASEYLSGDVQKKLAAAKEALQKDSDYQENVDALTKALPAPLTAAEIEVHLGAPWVPLKYYNEFMHEKFAPSDGRRADIRLVPPVDGGVWTVTNFWKNNSNFNVVSKYGTNDMNAYEILACLLSLRDPIVRVKDPTTDAYFVDREKTQLAQAKAKCISEEFDSWIFENAQRREELVNLYNEKYNGIRLRHFDGSMLDFPGKSKNIELMEHQKNAAARMIFSGENTLLAHAVGSGKTYECITGIMERKRLGLTHKALLAVPNHLTEQWASDFYRLYPGANVLVATAKSFSPQRRDAFLSKVARGEYDAVIVSHSQLDRIPLSNGARKGLLERRKSELNASIEKTKDTRDHPKENQEYTETEKRIFNKNIKDMERQAADLQRQINNISETEMTAFPFESLGFDLLVVDEAHYYKNVPLDSHMGFMSGLNTEGAKKSAAMLEKCEYMNSITHNNGIIFATGTPVTNSISEMYNMQKFLQPERLREYNFPTFDSWIGSFGSKETNYELAPDGTSWRAKSRFSKFYNLPELLNIFQAVADLRPRAALSLDVPEAIYHEDLIQPSPVQKELVQSLAERAKTVSERHVYRHDRRTSELLRADNMLKITGDGRKAALDQRLINPYLLDPEDSKTTILVNNAMERYRESADIKGTQIIFSDMSKPCKGFNVYDDVKQKLIDRGVPKEEIAFIYDASTEKQKEQLFQKVRDGEVRFLLGSTAKLGVGTNIQDRMVAIHHLDVPWRPADLEQREARGVRPGNMNSQIHIYRYVTEGTFDAYMWQTLERKQRFIAQIMSGDIGARSSKDVDDRVLDYTEIKALCSGNPIFREKMEIDSRLEQLKIYRNAWTNNRYNLQDEIEHVLPYKIETLEKKIEAIKSDITLYEEETEKMAALPVEEVETAEKTDNPAERYTGEQMELASFGLKSFPDARDAAETDPEHAEKGKKKKEEKPKEPFRMEVRGKVFTDEVKAGEELYRTIERCHNPSDIRRPLGKYKGFTLYGLNTYDLLKGSWKTVVYIRGAQETMAQLTSGKFAVYRIEQAMQALPEMLQRFATDLEETKERLEGAKAIVDAPFEYEEELKELTERSGQVDAAVRQQQSINPNQMDDSDLHWDDLATMTQREIDEVFRAKGLTVQRSAEFQGNFEYITPEERDYHPVDIDAQTNTSNGETPAGSTAPGREAKKNKDNKLR